MDKYASFKDLQDNEVEGIDYRILGRAGSTGVALLCIHGGNIEPGTSEIAEAIAGHDHTFYALEGLKRSGNKSLHITSTAFDEPASIETACNSQIILSIHGCSKMEETVYLGGRDKGLGEWIAKKLAEYGFEATLDSDFSFKGKDPRNICNASRRGMGVQIELSLGLRRRMFKDLTTVGRQSRTEVFYRFVLAVRDALKPVGPVETKPSESFGREIIG